MVIALVWPREREPEYQGKKLSEWLELNRHGSPSGAKEAVRHMGTNCIPLLLSWSDYTGSENWTRLRSVLHRLPIIRNYVPRRELRAYDAVEGFRILGSAATLAIPELARRARESPHGTVRSLAIESLSEIGVSGLPALISLYQTKRLHADGVMALGGILAVGNRGQDITVAVPMLLKEWSAQRALSPADSVREKGFRRLLGELCASPSFVPAVAINLEHQDPQIRAEAAMVLGGIGNRAQLTVSNLVGRFDDPDETVRIAVTNAVQKIAPQMLNDGTHVEQIRQTVNQ